MYSRVSYSYKLPWGKKIRSTKEDKQSGNWVDSRIIWVRSYRANKSLITVPSAMALSWSNQTLFLALKSPKTRLKRGLFWNYSLQGEF